jgi:AbrB family looped-hinge helix DNA binding protein
MTSTISSKGQITVPKPVRDRLGLRAGTPVEFELVAGGVVVRKGRRGGRRPVDAVRGVLKRTASTAAILAELRGATPPGWKRRS